jgi:uncharacterized protein (TIGR02001 family)
LDLYYKEIYYAGIWGSNVDFGAAPNGWELANIELDYYVGIAPAVGEWSFDIAAYYIAYPGAFDRVGVQLCRDLDRRQPQLLRRQAGTDTIQLLVARIFGPDLLEVTTAWTFDKVWYFTPKLSGKFGQQWGDVSQGGYDCTYWSAALTLGFNAKLPLEFEIRYWDSFDFDGFRCAPSGVDACNNLVVGSLKATF